MSEVLEKYRPLYSVKVGEGELVPVSKCFACESVGNSGASDTFERGIALLAKTLEEEDPFLMDMFTELAGYYRRAVESELVLGILQKENPEQFAYLEKQKNLVVKKNTAKK